MAHTAAKDLKFLRTMTIEDFKQEIHANKIGAKELTPGNYSLMNKDLNKVVGSVSWRVSKPAEYPDGITKPVISEVQGRPTELNPTGIFFLLHQLGENATATEWAEW